MSDAASQLAEIDALIAASPNDPSLQTLRGDLLELITLENQQQSQPAVTAHNETIEARSRDRDLKGEEGQPAGVAADGQLVQHPPEYAARGTFTEHIASEESVAAAPDLAPFEPVVNSSTSSQRQVAATKTDGTCGDANETPTDEEATKKKRKKKKSSKNDELINAKFELPTHLIPLDSDTSAQKQKKTRAGKALKSKFRAKQKELEAEKKQNDWKSFAMGGKRNAFGGSSMFATEEGVNAKVGVISGGSGGRKMTGQGEGGKRHKFD